MEATYKVNGERVEIRFPKPPEKPVRRELHAKEFEYDPTAQTWSKGLVTNAKVQAARIVYNFNCDQGKA